MFETFSKQFEGYFKNFFGIWVLFWGTINVGQLLFSYAQFANNSESITRQPGGLGLWWLNTLATVLTISVGIFLYFMMNSNHTRVAKSKKISNIGIMTGLAVIYYLMKTGVEIFGNAIFDPSNFATAFIGLTAWLFPSVIMLVVHILYFTNLSKFNEELEGATVVETK